MYQPGDDAAHLIAGPVPVAVVQHREHLLPHLPGDVHSRGDPLPAVGDYCDDCACACDRCGEEYGERDMVADADGRRICPECAEGRP